MYDFINAAILGVVEGITEFLPISSTGHLILTNKFISFSPEFTKKFDIIIQFGAILSVLLIYRKKLLNKSAINLWINTIVAVIPALIAGFLFHEKIEELLFNPVSVAIALIIGGIIILITKIKSNSKELTKKNAFYIGLFQCLALIPGTSRSAATIIGALLLGHDKKTAVEFSFFLAIPTLFAASAYSLLKIDYPISTNEIQILAVGFIVSFIVATIVIKWFISYLEKKDFKIFGIYRIILGGLILMFMY